MAEWLTALLPHSPVADDTVAFPPFLLEHLQADATAQQLQTRQGFHVGAFERREGYRVPVFWIVSNCGANEATGTYDPFPAWEFRSEEQLLGRDYRVLRPQDVLPNLKEHVRRYGSPLWYRNGDLFAFAAAGNAIDLAAAWMLQNSQRGYQVPRSLNRWQQLAETYVRASSAMAQVYYRRGTPTIGGQAISVTVPWN
jgi:hypothetical protein